MDLRKPAGTDNSLRDALREGQRWIEDVTGKLFPSQDFRQSLSDGILLCELINVISPGSVRRINRLPTMYAFLDNLKSFLQACKGLGLEGSQLFDTTDLQGRGSRQPSPATDAGRKLRNVAITIYWLGRKANGVESFNGPGLEFGAFQNLIGTKKSIQLYGPEGSDDDSAVLMRRGGRKRSFPNGKEGGMMKEPGDDEVDEEERQWRMEEAKKLKEAAERKRRSQEMMLEEEDDPTAAVGENNVGPRELAVRISKVRRGESGFGFSVGGGRDGKQVYVESIQPGSSSSLSNLQPGDEIVFVNGVNVEGASKQKVLTLISRGDVIGNISLRIKRGSTSLSSPASDDSAELPNWVVPEEDRETTEEDEEAPPLPPPPVALSNDDDVLEEKVAKEQARIERMAGRRRQRQEESPGKRWSATAVSTNQASYLTSRQRRASDEVGLTAAITGTQRARQKWMNQDKAAMDLVKAASLPRKSKKPFTFPDAQKRARSVEKEQEEIEALKQQRLERERERERRTGSALETRIRAELSPGRIMEKQSSQEVRKMEGILGRQRDIVRKTDVEMLKVDAAQEEHKRLSQSMQEETRAEFEKRLMEKQEMSELEREAERLLEEAERELAMFDQKFSGKEKSEEKKEERKPKEKPRPPIRRSMSPLLSHLREEGSGPPEETTVVETVPPFVRDVVPMLSVAEPKSRFSLSVWGTLDTGIEQDDGSSLENEDGDVELDGFDMMELDNEMEKLHQMEMQWAKEQMEERKKKGAPEESSAPVVMETMTTTLAMMVQETPEVVVVPPPVMSENEVDSFLQSKLETQRKELEEERRSLELAKERQRAEEERLEEEMRRLEAKRREMEEESRRAEEERLRREVEMEEEIRRRREEEEERRLAEVERQRRMEEEEEERARGAAADARREMVEERRRQEQLARELEELELIDERRREMEEEERQRESYHEDMAFIKQVASVAEPKEIVDENDADADDDDDDDDDDDHRTRRVHEEEVRRVREDIEHAVKAEDRKRLVDNPEGNRGSKLFIAHTVFDEGVYTTEM